MIKRCLVVLLILALFSIQIKAESYIHSPCSDQDNSNDCLEFCQCAWNNVTNKCLDWATCRDSSQCLHNNNPCLEGRKVFYLALGICIGIPFAIVSIILIVWFSMIVLYALGYCKNVVCIPCFGMIKEKIDYWRSERIDATADTMYNSL